ncbi:hypothetical protein FCG67_01265 [Rhodococcus oryzae]|uniref:Helix-turn-helix domain-containing protein n=1 Tax=Rhodococcus oryzae TaxID=2571143 RepID=A0ABY2RQH8_9NOCA|nr:hypothetical protein [Rhodococcus oryzae]TJZ81308.1 hypothetical protein FCG67_01265 [Rhodococcus oryzae]
MDMDRDQQQLYRELARDKAREKVARINYLRHLRQLYESGLTQVALAEVENVSQPTISDLLKRARFEAPDVRPGTHGGTAYEIAARYAAGEIDSATVRRELIEWAYEKPGAPNPFPYANDVPPIKEGGFNNQVGRALDEGLLADEDYDAVLDALAD